MTTSAGSPMSQVRQTDTDKEDLVHVELTAREVQLIFCALAGNHPPALADSRPDLIRKLTPQGVPPRHVSTPKAR